MSEYSGFANLAWPQNISAQNLMGFRDLAFFTIISFFFSNLRKLSLQIEKTG